MYHNSFYDERLLGYEPAMYSKMDEGSHIGFEIKLVSLDIFIPITLRNFHAKGDICIMTWSQKALNMSTMAINVKP